MQLIDADKTLETLEGLTELVIGEGAALVKALTFAALKSKSVVPTVGGWISVKDRLPEVNKSILYCAFGRSVGEGVYRGFDGLHHVWSMYAVGGTHWDDEVTHWMPLPESPEEQHG